MRAHAYLCHSLHHRLDLRLGLTGGEKDEGDDNAGGRRILLAQFLFQCDWLKAPSSPPSVSDSLSISLCRSSTRAHAHVSKRRGGLADERAGVGERKVGAQVSRKGGAQRRTKDSVAFAYAKKNKNNSNNEIKRKNNGEQYKSKN